MNKCTEIHDQITLAANEADGHSMLLSDGEKPLVLSPKNHEEIEEIKFKSGRVAGALWALGEIIALLDNWDLTGPH